jgi:hypothetical protein
VIPEEMIGCFNKAGVDFLRDNPEAKWWELESKWFVHAHIVALYGGKFNSTSEAVKWSSFFFAGRDVVNEIVGASRHVVTFLCSAYNFFDVCSANVFVVVFRMTILG